jgi:hypothetical protein
VAAQGSTDNLMDYKGNTELWHHQWKKIQNPERVWLAFAEEEEEGEAYSKKEIVDFLNIIRKKNAGQKPKLNTIIRAIDIYQDQFIKDSAQYYSMTKEEYISTLTHNQILAFDQKKTEGNNPWDDNPIILAHKANIKLKLDDQKDSVSFIVSINGYSKTNNVFTTWVSTERENNRAIFYNAIYADKTKDKNLKDVTDIKNNRKAFDISVHDSTGFGTFQQLLSFLKIIGEIDFSEKADTGAGKLILNLKRIKSSDYITIGELTIKGIDNIKLLTLELGRGKSQRCTEEEYMKYECNRIDSGKYRFQLHTTGTPQHKYKSLELLEVPNRSGILIHRGNAYSWSMGCILLMVAHDIDEVLSDPISFLNESIQGFYSTERNIPILALYDYIEKYDPDENLTKEIHITNNDVDFIGDTKINTIFNNRKRAAQIYFDNQIEIENLANALVDSVAKIKIDKKIQEIDMQNIIENKKTLLSYALSTESRKKELDDTWDATIKLTDLSVETIQIETVDSLRKILKAKLETTVKKSITDDNVSIKQTIYDLMFSHSNSNVEYEPYPPFYAYYLFMSNSKNVNAKKIKEIINENFVKLYLNQRKNEIIENEKDLFPNSTFKF